MKIKTFILIIITTALLIPFNQGCGKYEEGPSISLRTKTSRLKGIWDIKDYTNFDFSFIDNWTFEFEKEGGFTSIKELVAGNTETMKGEWEFVSDKEAIGINWEDEGEADVEYTIIMLKDKEMILKDASENEINLVKQE